MLWLKACIGVDDAGVAPCELLVDGRHWSALEIDGDLRVLRRTRSDREPSQAGETPEGGGNPQIICGRALAAHRVDQPRLGPPQERSGDAFGLGGVAVDQLVEEPRQPIGRQAHWRWRRRAGGDAEGSENAI